MVKIALREDVFENYIQNSNLYIDKSLFTRDVIDDVKKVSDGKSRNHKAS